MARQHTILLKIGVQAAVDKFFKNFIYG